LDDEMRGKIEKQLDQMLKPDMNWLESVKWITDELIVEPHIESLVLGYITGSLTIAYGITLYFNRAWSDIFGENKESWENRKDIKYFLEYVKQEDVADIKKIIKRRLPEIRQLISQQMYK